MKAIHSIFYEKVSKLGFPYFFLASTDRDECRDLPAQNKIIKVQSDSLDNGSTHSVCNSNNVSSKSYTFEFYVCSPVCSPASYNCSLLQFYQTLSKENHSPHQYGLRTLRSSRILQRNRTVFCHVFFEATISFDILCATIHLTFQTIRKLRILALLALLR